MIEQSELEAIARRIKACVDAGKVTAVRRQMLVHLSDGQNHMQVARSVGSTEDHVSVSMKKLRALFNIPSVTEGTRIERRLRERAILVNAWSIYEKQAVQAELWKLHDT
ncbi:MAG: hypothetical protein JWL88_610 [Parcubacteria group bacterium]|nr:hypothetical protein [Parcubacteria group bacterium]